MTRRQTTRLLPNALGTLATLGLVSTLLLVSGTARADAPDPERTGCLTATACQTDEDCCIDCRADDREAGQRGRCWAGRCLHAGACAQVEVERPLPADEEREDAEPAGEDVEPPGPEGTEGDLEADGQDGDVDVEIGGDAPAEAPLNDQLLEVPAQPTGTPGDPGSTGGTAGSDVSAGQVEGSGQVTVTLDADGNPVGVIADAVDTGADLGDPSGGCGGEPEPDLGSGCDAGSEAAGAGCEAGGEAAGAGCEAGGEAAGAACSGAGDAISCSVVDGQRSSAGGSRRTGRAGNALLWSLVIVAFLARRRRTPRH